MPRKTRKDMVKPKRRIRKGQIPKPTPWYDEDKFIVNIRKSILKGGKKNEQESQSK